MKIRKQLPFTSLTASFLLAISVSAFGEKDQVSRQGFVLALNVVTEGMSQKEVQELLGLPDESCRSNEHSFGATFNNVTDVWRYGTDGSCGLATLGAVFFNSNGTVCRIVGKGVAISEEILEEKELRDVLGLLSFVQDRQIGSEYNPGHVIRAVNALSLLSKEGALSVIQEFSRIEPRDQGMMVVLRVLFDVPGELGHAPEMQVGASTPSAPDDPRLFPRFPIAIEDDIPFLLVGSYALVGVAQPVEEHVRFFHEHGRLRSSRLSPRDNPVNTLKAFLSSERWMHWDMNSDMRRETKEQLEEQVARLLETVYVAKSDDDEDRLLPDDDEDKREETLSQMSRLQIRWDSSRQMFTFQDGTTLRVYGSDEKTSQ